MSKERIEAIHGHLYETRDAEDVLITRHPNKNGDYLGTEADECSYTYSCNGHRDDDNDDEENDYDLVKDITPSEWLEEATGGGPVEVKIGGKTLILSLKK